MTKYYSKLQLFFDLFSVICLIATATFLLLTWGDLPESLPTHYSFSGEIDAWGGKSSVLFLPLIAVGLFILITLVGFFPKIWNLPVKLTPENKERVLTRTKDMMAFIKMVTVAVFCYLTYVTASLGPLSQPVIVAFLVILFSGVLIYFIYVKKLA